MSRRKTVNINLPVACVLIKKEYRHNIVFCEAMGRGNHPTWVSDWGRKAKDGSPAPKNLPSPEEAVKMCSLLNTTPEEILTEPDDIELVSGLIEAERATHGIKKDLPQGEVGEAKKKLLDAVFELSDSQCEKLLGIIQEAKKLL